MSVTISGTTGLSNVPAGNIAATDTQSAINELDAEKAMLAGNVAQTFSAAPATAAAHAVQLGQPGHPVQVVYLNYGTQTTTTSTTPVATPFTVTITPKFASSKILLQWSLGDVLTTSGANGVGLYIYKNALPLVRTAMRTSYVNGTTIRNNGAGIYVDSPATTSSTTYTIYYDNGGLGSASICYESSWGSLVATEITA